MDVDPTDRAAELHAEARDRVEAGDLDAAAQSCREALELFRAHSGDDHPDVANTLKLECEILTAQGAFVAARDAGSRAVAIMAPLVDHYYDDQPELARIHVQTLVVSAFAAQKLGAYAEAEAALHRAMELGLRFLGADDLDVAGVLNGLGIVCKYLCRFDDAADYYRRALAVLEAAHGPDSPELASLYHNLGGLDHARGDFAAAEAPARKAVELRERALGPDHPTTAADVAALAAVVDELGRGDEARQLYERAIATFEASFGPDHHEVAFNLAQLGALHAAAGRIDDAAPLVERGLAGLEALHGNGHQEVATTRQQLAVIRYHQGRLHEARELCARAQSALEAIYGPDHPRVQDCIDTATAIDDR